MAAYRRLIYWVNMVGAWAVFGLMWLIFFDVAGRQLFRLPVQGTFEISESAMVLIVFFGLAYGQQQKAHIKIDVLTQRLPSWGKSLSEALAGLVGSVLFALVLVESLRYAIGAWQIRQSTYGMVTIPVWPARFAVPIGALLLSIQFTVDLYSDLRKLVNTLKRRQETV